MLKGNLVLTSKEGKAELTGWDCNGGFCGVRACVRASPASYVDTLWSNCVWSWGTHHTADKGKWESVMVVMMFADDTLICREDWSFALDSWRRKVSSHAKEFVWTRGAGQFVRSRDEWSGGFWASAGESVENGWASVCKQVGMGGVSAVTCKKRLWMRIKDVKNRCRSWCWASGRMKN